MRVIRLPGIHHDAVCTLVIGEMATVIVDSGTSWYQVNLEERIREQLARFESAPVCAIVVTHRHFDSAGAANHLSAAFGAPVMAHADAHVPLSANDLFTTWASRFDSDMPITETVDIADGWTYDLGSGSLVALHTPGHTSCHLSLHLPEKRLLIAGDLVPAADHPARWDMPTGNPIQMLASIERVIDLDLKMLVTSRGDSVRGAAAVTTVLERHSGFLTEAIAARGEAPFFWPKPAATCMYWTPEPAWTDESE